MKREPYRYALLLATRGRPWNLERLHATIQDTAERPDLVDIWCYIDGDDPSGLAAYQATGVPVHRWIEGPRIKLAASWNELAVAAAAHREVGRHYSHFLLWGDDVIPETLGWDRIFAERSKAFGPGFFYGRDGIWDDRPWFEHPEHIALPTAVAMSIEAYEALGYVSPPGVLKHLCIDMVWRDLGVESGTLHYCPDVMVRHLHRLVGAPDDDTYREANDGQQKTDDFVAYPKWRDSEDFWRDVEKLERMWVGADLGGKHRA